MYKYGFKAKKGDLDKELGFHISINKEFIQKGGWYHSGIFENDEMLSNFTEIESGLRFNPLSIYLNLFDFEDCLLGTNFLIEKYIVNRKSMISCGFVCL